MKKIMNKRVTLFSMTVLMVMMLCFTSETYKGKPYLGKKQEIPGRVQCEYYDEGGEGISYHDSDSINNGSGRLNPVNGNPLHEFRLHEGVDISYTKANGIDDNPYNEVMPLMDQLYVGWTVPGEWIKYTVNIRETGLYSIGLMYTCNGDGAIEITGEYQNSSGIMPVASTHKYADTVAWRQRHHWNRVDSLGSIRLQQGTQTITLKTIHNGNMNYDWIEFRKITHP